MLITVTETAEIIGGTPNHVYYLLSMGQIEAIKVGDTWRVYEKAVRDYAQSRPAKGDRNTASDLIRSGCRGFLFGLPHDGIPDDLSKEDSRVQRRKRDLEHKPRRSNPCVQPQFKPVRQLDLFFDQGEIRSA